MASRLARKLVVLLLAAGLGACAPAYTVPSAAAPSHDSAAASADASGSQLLTGRMRAVNQTIAPRDLLDVIVFDAPDLSRVVRVSDDGMVSLPLLGPIRAAGRTPRELEVGLQDTLRSTYMRDPRVSVTVQQPAPRPVYVVGEVNQPGAYVPSSEDQLTVLRAMAVARGPKPSAAQGRAFILRPKTDGDPLQIPINLNDVVKGRSPDLVLAPNDILYVPKHTERAIALGVVDALVGIVTFRVPLRR